ncbi:hypothetical protein LguiB_015707 [Lonicera macranthoides]
MRNAALTLTSSIFIPPQNNNSSTNPKTPTNLPSSKPSLSSTVRYDLFNGHRDGHKFYADIASKLALAGRMDDFFMLAESVVASGVKPRKFVNSELVSCGIARMIKEGGARGVVRVLSAAQELGFGLKELFGRDAVEALSIECCRMLRCGEVEAAVDLMETLAGFRFPVKELVEPSEVIKVCVNKGKPNAAIRHALIFPHAHILFCTIILEFGKKGDLASALTVFEASKENLSCPNMYIYRTIIDACGLCGDYLKSRSIYEELLAQNVTPNQYVFNSLMNVNAPDLSYTLQVYKHMKKIGVTADMTSFNILLKSCCLASRVDLAQDIYRELRILESRGALKLDVFTYSTIIKVFADARMWQMALQIKEDMLAAGVTLNTVTWSSLISACANAGLLEQALKLFDEMVQSNCEPNSQCCNILLHACVEARQYDRAFHLFHSLKGSALHENYRFNTVKNTDTSDSHDLHFAMRVPFTPSTSTYNILMKACGTDYLRAKALMDEMNKDGLSPNLTSWSILIDVCGGARNVKGAMQILKSMREAGIQPDVVAYTAAIKVCVRNKQLSSAFSLFSEMKIYQIQPNQVTYNTLLRARTRYGSIQEVQQCLAIYQDMRKAGYKSNDYYLEQLIEEWCEGIIIQDNNQNEGQQRDSCNRTKDLGGPQSLLLEKVAAHLQKSDAESLAVDLRGLTKVEARIVVLAVLRMIKESYIPGDPIKDDMSILLGVQEVGAGAVTHKFNMKDAIIKLLQDELGLEVLLTGPRIPTREDVATRSGTLPTKLDSPAPTRRPAVLLRLKVPKESLLHWLHRRFGAYNR